MTSILLLLLALLAVGVLAASGLRAVARDGLGLRPPPAVRPEHETMGTWPR
jgi:hypothetical protein